MTGPRQRRFSPEVRERAVRLVLQHQGDHASQWAAISSLAAKIGCTGKTLRGWLRQSERDSGKRPDTTSDDRERIKSLERENRELRAKPEITARRGFGRPLKCLAKGSRTDSVIRRRALSQANEILRKASAYFAQAELDRRFTR